MKTKDSQIVKCVEYALRNGHTAMLWKLAELFNIRASFEDKLQEISKVDYEEGNSKFEVVEADRPE